MVVRIESWLGKGLKTQLNHILNIGLYLKSEKFRNTFTFTNLEHQIGSNVQLTRSLLSVSLARTRYFKVGPIITINDAVVKIERKYCCYDRHTLESRLASFNRLLIKQRKRINNKR